MRHAWIEEAKRRSGIIGMDKAINEDYSVRPNERREAATGRIVLYVPARSARGGVVRVNGVAGKRIRRGLAALQSRA